MATPMGMGLGLGGSQVCFFRKFRWLFRIDGISVNGIYALPPLKSARPTLTFREFEVQHTTETIYYPAKPEWKPLNLVLYDFQQLRNPVVLWFQQIYNSCNGSWNTLSQNYKRKAYLDMLGGCGDTLETWVFENAWPNNIDFSELDMASSEVCTIDCTLRYDRAYLLSNC